MTPQLHLDITELSCRCGNRWTHSRTWLKTAEGGLGGTPTPEQSFKLPYTSLSRAYANTDGCWRCVPLQLSEGWTKPLAYAFERQETGTKTATEKLEEELLK